jgi:hypothetical protein
VWQELDYRIDICHVTKGGHIEHLQGRTETCSVSPSVDMLLFGVTILATVPQRSEIPEGLTNYLVLLTIDTVQLECSESTTHMHKCINHCIWIFRPEVFMIVKV